MLERLSIVCVHLSHFSSFACNHLLFSNLIDADYLQIDARQALQLHLQEAYQTYELQAAMTREALLSCFPQEHGRRK